MLNLVKRKVTTRLLKVNLSLRNTSCLGTDKSCGAVWKLAIVVALSWPCCKIRYRHCLKQMTQILSSSNQPLMRLLYTTRYFVFSYAFLRKWASSTTNLITTYLTVWFLAQRLAVYTCPNVLVKGGLLTDAPFSRFHKSHLWWIIVKNPTVTWHFTLMWRF